MRKRPVVLALLALLVLLPALAGAQGLRDRLQHAREASRQERPVAVPAGGTAIRNVAYGPDPAQRFDVYLPARAANAPVVFRSLNISSICKGRVFVCPRIEPETTETPPNSPTARAVASTAP